MDATVVITRYKEPNSILNDTLYSVSKQIWCKLNIFMLDQFFNKDTELLCKSLNENPHGHIFEYRLIEPISLSYARNLWISESLNDIVMCIDPDAIASENRASSTIKCFETHKNTAIVWTKIIPKRNWKKNIFLFSSFFRADYSMLDLWNEIIEDVPKVIWASFSVHKWRLWNIELFDWNLWRKNGNLLWGEETDLCQRARKKWLKVTYNWEWYVLHQVSKERLSYSRIIKRIFWWWVSRALSHTKPEPHKIKRKVADYIFLPFYLAIYISWLIYGKIRIYFK